MTYRFRLIPTFGRDTIRKFSGDVSGMKKMSARHFEDILQVNHAMYSASHALNLSPFSVVSPYSMVSYFLLTTRPFSICCSTWEPGMHMQNSGNTLNTHSAPSS